MLTMQNGPQFNCKRKTMSPVIQEYALTRNKMVLVLELIQHYPWNSSVSIFKEKSTVKSTYVNTFHYFTQFYFKQ